MREDLLNELENEYAARRAENERTEAARRAVIRKDYPAISRLVDDREELVRGAIRSILNGGPGGDGLTERMEKLNREIREKLGDAGLPEDYLAPVYTCPLCRDTGYTGEVVRERCRCMIQAYQRKLRQQIGLDRGREETFENFNSGMIPDEKLEGRRFSQRENAERARDNCRKWADQYPDVPQRDILLTGKSGLGKTYLMHAMANRLADRGIQVLMISAYQFFQLARKAYFEGEDVPEEIMESPILMLDDVGSEPLMKNLPVDQLFNVINERRNHGRSTILSTNLNLEEFRERYTERIASRISDPRNSLTIPLEGADLRKAGK